MELRKNTSNTLEKYVLKFEYLDNNVDKFGFFSKMLSVIQLTKTRKDLSAFLNVIIVENVKIFKVAIGSINKKFRKNRVRISQLLGQFRNFLYSVEILKMLMNNKKTFNPVFYKFTECCEIIRIFSEKKVINLLKISPLTRSTKIKAVGKVKKKFYLHMKVAEGLFLVNGKEFNSIKNENFVYLLIVNSFLVNQLFSIKFYLSSYQTQREMKLKIGKKTKSLFKFIKKEVFFNSIELAKRSFKNSCSLSVLKGFKNVIIEICGKTSVCFHDFNFLRKFLSFFKILKFLSFNFHHVNKKSCETSQNFFADIFYKLRTLCNSEFNKFSQKNLSSQIIKGVVLSNSLKKFTGFICYLLAIKSLKSGLENSWRIQVTKRNLDFSGLNLNFSMLFSSKIIKFIVTFFIKITLKMSKEVFLIDVNQKSFSFTIFFEKFFLKWYSFSGFSSLVITKQINRILALGNIYLLTIFRIRKIITIQKIITKFGNGIGFSIKKNILFKIFHKKIEILLKNLNNSLMLIKMH